MHGRWVGQLSVALQLSYFEAFRAMLGAERPPNATIEGGPAAGEECPLVSAAIPFARGAAAEDEYERELVEAALQAERSKKHKPFRLR